jgi:hypothetical protein
MGSGVVLVVNTVMSSGDLLRLVASNREDYRGFEVAAED